jgi:phosphoglucosamine mutase
MAIDDYIDAKIIRTRVGDVFVSEEVKKSKAEFGGEPSGTWIFPDQSYCPDGILAAARLVEMASKKKLSELTSKIPRYQMLRGAVSYNPKFKEMILRNLDKAMRALKCDELLTLDGYRFQYEDGWALVRPSGTEPKIRLLAESRTEKRAGNIMNTIDNIVKRACK